VRPALLIPAILVGALALAVTGGIVGALLVNRPAEGSAVDAPLAPTEPAAAPTVEAPAPDLYAGTWTGPVAGDKHPYSVVVTIAPGSTGYTATASYPELPCAATWAETGRPGETVTFLETLTSGRCFDNVPVTISALADGNLSYSAFSGGLTITSTLVRSP
jgi:hypothetical protein